MAKKAYKPQPWRATYMEGPPALVPGWQIKERKFPHTPVAIVPEPYGGIKENGRSPYQTANAQLIANAPYLLNAAKEVLDGLVERVNASPKNKVPIFKGINALDTAVRLATKEASHGA